MRLGFFWFFDFPPSSPTSYEILSVNGNRESILVEINLRMNNNRSILPLLGRFVGYFFEWGRELGRRSVLFEKLRYLNYSSGQKRFETISGYWKFLCFSRWDCLWEKIGETTEIETNILITITRMYIYPFRIPLYNKTCLSSMCAVCQRPTNIPLALLHSEFFRFLHNR